ncbi:MAG: PIN domain-containing protein [Dehalococcoidia bacterium]|nr:MAG: PIN domain-containing protein [Dehalococcoidia bacterium]
MNSYVCLDTSVLVKILAPEEDSDKALALLDKVTENHQIIALPAFAWVEVGTVLRKKRRRDILAVQETDNLWQEYQKFPGIEYHDSGAIMERAWKISRYFDLPTLYDAAFMAVAEVTTERTGDVCEFWTADEKLVNLLGGRREYVKLLREFK